MGFRMTVFSAPAAQNRTSPDTKLDCFPLQDRTRPRPSPLAIVRERLFLNSESEDLWLSATCAVSLNGGRRSRNGNSPARIFVPGLINSRSGFFREPGN
jgi:hypothetical protein